MAESKRREPPAPPEGVSPPLVSAKATAECPAHLRAQMHAPPPNGSESSAAPRGVLPSLGVDLLVTLVRAFDYRSVGGIVSPMRHISHSIAEFQPMSLWEARAKNSTGGSNLELEGLEQWMSQCAISSQEVRSSAVVA